MHGTVFFDIKTTLKWTSVNLSTSTCANLSMIHCVHAVHLHMYNSAYGML